MKKLILAAMIAFVPGVASAAPLGVWEGHEAEMVVESKISENYYKVDIQVSIPGCAGEAEGKAYFTPHFILFSAADPNDFTAPKCEIILKEDDDGNVVSSMSGGCEVFHGASCDFNGISMVKK